MARARLALLALPVALSALAACEDHTAELDAITPRLSAMHERVRAVGATLPARGAERPVPCAAPLAGITVHTLDERFIGGGDDVEEHARYRAFVWSSSALRVPTRARLEQSDTLGSAITFLGRRLDVAERATHVAMLRETTYDAGRLSGETIERPAHYAGWVFLASVSPPQLLGAWPIDVTSADEVSGIVRRSDVGDLLESSVHARASEAISASLATCGVTLAQGVESQF